MPILKGSPTLLRSMSEMSDDEIESLVETIRKRRNSAEVNLNAGKAFMKQLSDSSLRDRLEREITKTENAIKRLDNAINKVDTYILNIRALHMQLE